MAVRIAGLLGAEVAGRLGSRYRAHSHLRTRFPSPGVMDWLVRRGSGKLLIITNSTSGPVTNVKMNLRGRAVGGMFGDPIWSWTSAEVAHGGGIEAPFGAAWGAQADPPRIEIIWTSADGVKHSAVLDDLPL